ncbi:MICOS complex subunit MIC19 [Venturia canescens]|uniref:MICOS complex subunit MIC19 n=1 Tax=Venturia canescens TaxID=32260 RepID=UPI001C9C83D1|nr:MICOS complex subunit MIC19 [Venturia canescens]
MGSGQSTRKLTITNDEELDVIHISEGVVKRLAQGVANPKTETPSPKEVKTGRQWESSSVKQNEKPEEIYGQPTPPPSRSYNVNPVQSNPEYTISALKMQQLKEEELRDQNIYWQRRMQNLKENHAKIDKILETEYQRAVDQVAAAQGKKKIDVSSVVPPCIENKEKVLRCYQDHPKEILKCSSLVEEFSNCVDQRRAGLIAARC